MHRVMKLCERQVRVNPIAVTQAFLLVSARESLPGTASAGAAVLVDVLVAVRFLVRIIVQMWLPGAVVDRGGLVRLVIAGPVQWPSLQRVAMHHPSVSI